MDIQEKLKYLINLPNIKFDELVKLLNTEFYNYDLILLIEKIIKNICKYDYYISKYFNNLEKIGKRTANSYAYSTNFLYANNAFVIKTGKEYILNKRYKNITSIKHEYNVGQYLNKLRKENIYNFAYVFGFFEGSLLIQDNDNINHIDPEYDEEDEDDEYKYDEDSNIDWHSKKVISFADYSKDIKVGYVIYEYIYPSISLSDYVKDSNNDFADFMKIYLQVVFALYVANDKYEYTHYDLHSGNILIKTLDKEIDLVYNIGKEKYIIRTNKLAVIIDYEYSFIYDYETNYKYGVKFIGVYEHIHDYNKSYFMYDIVKLLEYCVEYSGGYGTVKNNSKIYNGILEYLTILKNNMYLPLFSWSDSDDKKYLKISYSEHNDYSKEKYIEDIKDLDDIYKIINLNLNNNKIKNIETVYILPYFKYDFDIFTQKTEQFKILKQKLNYISKYNYINIDQNEDAKHNIRILKLYFKIYHIFNDIKYKYIIIGNAFAMTYSISELYLSDINLLKVHITKYLDIFKDKLNDVLKELSIFIQKLEETTNYFIILSYIEYIKDIITNFSI